MTDNRPVFCIVTAKGCPGCDGFKKEQYGVLMKLLESKPLLGRIRVVEIEYPGLGTPLPKKSTNNKYDIPDDLKRFISWFPTFVLINGASWNEGKELAGAVFNGSWNSNGIIIHDSVFNKSSPNESRNLRMTNGESIKSWIEEQLSKNNDVMNGPLKIENYQNKNDSKKVNQEGKVCSNKFRLL